MNILVTGGAGFIGSHTVVCLLEAGFNPIIVDNFSNSSPQVLQGLEKILGRAVPFYETDGTDQAAMERIFEAQKVQGVIHFAARKAVGESMERPLDYYRNNLDSILVLLELMEKYGTQSLIFSSSCTVYGEPDELPVKETTPVKPAASVYGNTKQIGEEIIRDVAGAGALKAISLRYFNPIGAHPSGFIGELPIGKPNNLVPYIVQTAAGWRDALTVFGTDYPTPDGSCIRDYIHVMDLADAHVAAMRYLVDRQGGSFYDVFNIGTGQGNSVLELIKTFEDISGRSLPYRLGPRRDGDVSSVWGDVEKAGKLLGWQARRSIREGLTDSWRWQQNLGEHPPG